jgi:8-oxo-dGTP pyrophosphatase MutT (NUDIX family)
MSYISGVSFVLVRPDGMILMQKRDDGGGRKIPYPNMWTIPGAHKEEAESHLETVIREVKEEFSLDVTPEQCVNILATLLSDTTQEEVFVCRVPQDAKPELHEGAEMAWMSLDQIKQLELAWGKNKMLPQLEMALKQG